MSISRVLGLAGCSVPWVEQRRAWCSQPVVLCAGGWDGECPGRTLLHRRAECEGGDTELCLCDWERPLSPGPTECCCCMVLSPVSQGLRWFLASRKQDAKAVGIKVVASPGTAIESSCNCTDIVTLDMCPCFL